MVKPGDTVRTIHGSIGVSGVVIRRAEDSPLDGGERWLIRWSFPDGRIKESRWSPDMLVPLDTPRENDPPVALVGTSSNGQWRTWLTRKGVIKTAATTAEAEMLLVDGLALDIIYPDTEDR